MELKRKYKSEERSEAGGLISSTMSASRYGSPAEYLDKMKSDGEFADHLFIQMTGAVLSADIIILYLHEDSTQNKMYIRIPGGSFGTNETGAGSPIFVLYFEDSKFSAGHYQAVRPVVNGPVIRDLYKRTGRDIAKELGLPDQGILSEYYNQSLKSQFQFEK